MSSGSLKIAIGDHDHVAGPADATVTLVEYGDYQCPHCAHAHSIVQETQQRMGERMRFVFRNFPLTEIHHHALHAAEAAESVAVHGGAQQFWQMHDAIFAHQQDSRTALSDAHLAQYAGAVGVDAEVVLADLERDAYEARVQEDFMSGVRSGVHGTPSFFINGERFNGNWSDVDEFVAALEVAAQRAPESRGG